MKVLHDLGHILHFSKLRLKPQKGKETWKTRISTFAGFGPQGDAKNFSML
jgi:hypothetical protein